MNSRLESLECYILKSRTSTSIPSFSPPQFFASLKFPSHIPNTLTQQ